MEKTGAEKINPYSSDGEKREQVEQMFDSIAPAYDFMNRAMTFGLHINWRNQALKDAATALTEPPVDILDIATGTGDLAFRLLELFPKSQVTGVDLSEGMLKEARKKSANLPSSLSERVNFEQGDSLNLRFPDNSFGLITVAYGVRNFENLRKGVSELYRVLRESGILCIIELSVPTGIFTRPAYNLYSRYLIPAIGRIVSGDSQAYSYLPKSIAAAPQRSDMTKILEDSGFRKCRWRSLTFGVVTYYIATK